MRGGPALAALFAVIGAGAASAQPSLTAESPMPSLPAGPFLPNHGPVRIGSDGVSYIAVWSDASRGLPQIFFSASDGTLTAGPLLLAEGRGPQLAPDIACAMGRCLVVWEDYRFAAGRVFATEVAGGGTTGAGFQLQADNIDQLQPHVSADSNGYLVTFTRRNVTGITGIRVARAGSVVGSLTVTSNDAFDTAAGFDGLSHWVTFSSGPQPLGYAMRVSEAGAVLDAPRLISTGALHDYPSVSSAPPGASAGVTGLLVWQDGLSPSRIWGGRVAPDGGLLDPDGFLVASGGGWNERPVAALLADTDLVVAYSKTTSASVYATRVLLDAGVRDPAGLLVSAGAPTTADRPAIACRSGDCLVAFSEHGANAPNYSDLRARTVDTNGVGAAELSLAPPANTIPSQRGPAVACDGAGLCLGVWLETTSSTASVIRGSRFALDAGLLDPAGLTIATNVPREADVSAAATPSQFMVAWAPVGHAGSVYAVRVAPDGSLADAAPVNVAGNTTFFGLASAGERSSYLLVWAGGLVSSSLQLGVTRLPISGAPVQLGVVCGPRAANRPALATGAQGTAVAWSAASGTAHEIYTALIPPDGGAPLGPCASISGLVNVSFTGAPPVPALTAGPGGFLVVWPQVTNVNTSLQGARLDPGGALTGTPFSVSSATANELEPSASFDGHQTAVVWVDERSGARQLLGTAFEADGGRFAEATVSPLPFNGAPALAAASDGVTALLYERLQPSPSTENVRVRWRFLIGFPDAGVTPFDAGVTPEDAGVDAGVDGGGGDAGVDGGVTRVPGVYRVGCGCNAGGAPLLLALLAVLRPRGGRRRSAPSPAESPCPAASCRRPAPARTPERAASRATRA